MAKQKVVIKVSMNGQKSRSKALKIVVGACGVESAAFKGDDKSQIEVTGEGLDPAELTQLLRKKVGHADLVSVSPASGGDKKKEDKEKENETKLPMAMVWQPAYYGVGPCYDVVSVVRDPYHDPNSCSIM
ncbi:hypothetical protein ACOSP7_002969 [Xanthoceras sorbifolium]|uniref:HMA domain-containing protein n=1 Tax=Xanthoceras sorbifolium TaxID=99658 RepID=A0ABQ8IIU8_9ROSI|nr:hypothetical protein JRO89_XS01G0113800 [Xanthoceras sorbifolium]